MINVARQKSSKPRIPALSRTLDDLCALTRDNVGRGDYWIIFDGYEVTIAQQKIGETPAGKVSIPRDVFHRFLRWYLTGDADMRKGLSDDQVKAAAAALAKAAVR